MNHPKKIKGFARKKFVLRGDRDSLLGKLQDILREAGFDVSNPNVVGADDSTVRLSFVYRGIYITTRKPVTCVSHGIIFFGGKSGTRPVRIPATLFVILFKIKIFTAVLFLGLCFILPGAISWYMKGNIDISPLSYLALPLGFIVYFHVRARVFRMFGNLIRLAER